MLLKIFGQAADYDLMINSIGSTHTSNVDPKSQTSSKPPASTQKQQNNSTPQDTVNIKSSGDVDHDGDSK